MFAAFVSARLRAFVLTSVVLPLGRWLFRKLQQRRSAARPGRAA